MLDILLAALYALLATMAIFAAVLLPAIAFKLSEDNSSGVKDSNVFFFEIF